MELSTLPEEKKAEYQRWFDRGKALDRQQAMQMLAHMREGSVAYEGLADGYFSTESL